MFAARNRWSIISQSGIVSPCVMKYGLAGDGRAGLEPVGGQQMGFGGVVDINGVDERAAPTDSPEPARAGAGDDPRKEVIVARPPDQMRSERDRGQIGRVGFEDRLFGECLRLWIGGLEPAGIRSPTRPRLPGPGR